jgi:hypothetical protein
MPEGRVLKLLCAFGLVEPAPVVDPVVDFESLLPVVLAPVVVPRVVTGMRSRGMFSVVSQHCVSELIISDLPVPCAAAVPMPAARVAVRARMANGFVMTISLVACCPVFKSGHA